MFLAVGSHAPHFEASVQKFWKIENSFFNFFQLFCQKVVNFRSEIIIDWKNKTFEGSNIKIQSQTKILEDFGFFWLHRVAFQTRTQQGPYLELGTTFLSASKGCE